MTKEVILTISGLYEVDGEADEPVEIITPGQYFWKNGKHYILFEEVMEGIPEVIRSRLVITEKQVEILRNGGTAARMVFAKDYEHKTIYQTPVGQLALSFCTDELQVEISEERIDVRISYFVMADGQVATENSVHLNICPKELKKFTD